MMECNSLILKNECKSRIEVISAHLLAECNHYSLICYGCPVNHKMVAKQLVPHMNDKYDDPEWVARWFTNMLVMPLKSGDLCYYSESVDFSDDYGRFACPIYEVKIANPDDTNVLLSNT